ncbi:class I SAM-dependent methyltransferase [Candidatus Symbiothrix dinenymphae]|uniref:class I SAM-dependent methyltransferase n=1 Tax=Candidatus Symbiothrix dinenymphae TaxID=467085 RepID=UPI000703489F|nr:class I SAM-dependent methyltransferase [Candidatus Symbiothrix dinenymphae]
MYELIDSGDYEKLERFGQYVLRRPEPQAVWRKAFSDSEWVAQTHAWFRKAPRRSELHLSSNAEGNEKGEWILTAGMPQQWFVDYTYTDLKLRFRLGLTSFKHVGIFPEQAENWNYIYDTVREIAGTAIARTGAHTVIAGLTRNPLPIEAPRVLNLFAYTGGASLAAKSAGADVTHVDSVKQVLNWSHENMEASGLDNIRWVCEDALKFVLREAKRGKKYHGILLDPPAYGRGPDGERWILEDDIAALMLACSQIIEPDNAFIVLNLYSMGFSALVADNLVRDYFPRLTQRESGELFLPDQANRKLPLSVFCRAKTGTSCSPQG